MGYRIDYGASEARKRSAPIIRHPVWAMTMCFFALFLVFTAFFWPEGRDALCDVVLPGDGAVTAAALQGMVSDLSEGATISEAVTAFCREIIAGAG